MSCLSTLELFDFELVCKDSRERVLSYRRRAYNLELGLTKFVPSSHITAFRNLQNATGLVISGSFALQFLERSHFTASDLDLYVDHFNAIFVADFLASLGYVYRPRTLQQPHFEKDILEYTPKMDRTASEGYTDTALTGAYDFVLTADSTTIIQLMTAATNPVDVILSFHSSIVMNIITHSYAHALYPMETFQRRRALFFKTETDPKSFSG
ncbi:hypothetical protein BD626DRAFT_578246 [Schizophyllum amplum]|uniref:Uncharacterized protein n=1 Tax=Schizophyllum amplum TaxID=97359 RepID=A0A550BS25_9AGAR|nr:hypothetical protein BD626DRAFT_578246 [Auriculariopsis ampla]